MRLSALAAAACIAAAPAAFANPMATATNTANPTATATSGPSSSAAHAHAAARAHATGGNARASGGSVTINQGAAGSGASGPSRAPDIGAPMLSSGNVCVGGAGAGGSGLMGGGFLSGLWEMSDCKRRQEFVLLWNAGMHDWAIATLCQIDHLREAGAAYCEKAKEAIAQPKAVPVDAPAHRDLPPWCLTTSGVELRNHKECRGGPS